MVEIKHYARDGKVSNITQLVGDISSSGDLWEVARRLELDIMRPDRLFGVNVPAIRLGEAVAMEEDGQEIYYGFVWSKDTDDLEAEQRLSCYDYLIYMMRSEPVTQVFVKKAPADIIRLVCKEIGVSVGTIPSVGADFSLNARNETAYSIIMMCCTQMHKATGKVYYPIMRNRKLCIIEKGELTDPVLEYRTEVVPGTLLSVKYQEALENMVNKIVIKDEKGSKVGVVSDKESLKYYGQVMKQYYKQKDEDANATAKNMLHSVDHVIQVTVSGDWRLRTGYSILFKTPERSSKFYIRSDVHHWSSGLHTTDLVLEYENAMDKKESEKVR